MFCYHPLRWSHVTRPDAVSQELRECRSQREHSYRFSVLVRRENYPEDLATGSSYTRVQPSHSLILRPAILITNLLPYELHFAAVRGKKGHITPGDNLALHDVRYILCYLNQYIKYVLF